MIKTLLSTVLIFASFLSQAMSLNEAYANKDIEVTIHGADSDLFENKSIQVNIVNKTSSTIKITEEPGYIFDSEDEDVQDMILTEPLMFVINEASPQSFGVKAMCIQAKNKSPRTNLYYKPGKYATGNLLKTSRYINENNFQNSMGQDAMWAISDFKSPYDITGPAEIANPLRAFVADLLGVAFDTSLINKNEIYLPKGIKEYALFLNFYLQKTDDIKLQLFDHKGDFVRDLMNKPKQGKGKYDMKYKIALYGLYGQKYYVRLYVGDDMRTEFPLLIDGV